MFSEGPHRFDCDSWGVGGWVGLQLSALWEKKKKTAAAVPLLVGLFSIGKWDITVFVIHAAVGISVHLRKEAAG